MRKKSAQITLRAVCYHLGRAYCEIHERSLRAGKAKENFLMTEMPM